MLTKQRTLRSDERLKKTNEEVYEEDSKDDWREGLRGDIQGNKLEPSVFWRKTI